MIITITPNPSVDQTVFLSGMRIDNVNRYQEYQLDPAGKGINASRMAHRLGWPTIAFGFLAGEMGAIVEKALSEEGVQHHFIRIAGQTRLNTTIVDVEGGTSTSFFGPGPAVDAGSLEQLTEIVRFWFRGSAVAVLAGSLPPGMPADSYAKYVELAREQGVQTVLDTDGEALACGIEAGPSLIKPNRAEAERLVGRPLPSVAAVVEGARELVDRGVGTVVISMGREGAICVTGNAAWTCVPPQVEMKSTVGSGDSMVAGLAIAMASGRSLVEGLRLGTAAGAATAMVAGTALGSRDDVYGLLPGVRLEPVY